MPHAQLKTPDDSPSSIGFFHTDKGSDASATSLGSKESLGVNSNGEKYCVGTRHCAAHYTPSIFVHVDPLSIQ